jgi:hypothetical protein
MVQGQMDGHGRLCAYNSLLYQTDPDPAIETFSAFALQSEAWLRFLRRRFCLRGYDGEVI